MLRRFVILFHTGHGPEHLDLMIELPRALATWRIEGPAPVGLLAAPVPATRLPDHRLAYLDTEGPVSGGRGEVRRIEAGKCIVDEATEGLWTIRFAGRVLAGRWQFRRLDEQGHWRLGK